MTMEVAEGGEAEEGVLVMVVMLSTFPILAIPFLIDAALASTAAECNAARNSCAELELA